jgi:Tfp pilus assembly protein PilO
MAHRPMKGTKPAARSPYRMLIVLGIVAAVGLFFAWNSVFLAPKARQRADVQKQLAAARKQQDDLRGQLGQLKKVAADMQSRQAEVVRLGRLIPGDPDVAGAILALNDTATRAQVAWSSFVPSPPAATPGVPGAPMAVPVAMKVAGTFGQVFDYLARLETLDRLVVVDGIALSGGLQPDGAVRVDADIKARMFAAGTAAAVPSPVAAVAAQTDLTEKPETALTKAGG